MILDIDIGNTRVKWILRGGEAGSVARGVFAHGQWDSWQDPFDFRTPVSRVRLSSVARTVDAWVCDICRKRWGLKPEVARVIDGAGGVTCGYSEPERLGVDRWLGVVAGWSMYAEAFIVVDAGSALTMDLVDSQGVHLGGYILPGFDMMKTSLGFHTWGVKVDTERGPEIWPGRDTSSAVINGALSAMLGAIERVAGRSGSKKVLLTGGDAEMLGQWLQAEVELTIIPDLVLNGLAIALP